MDSSRYYRAKIPVCGGNGIVFLRTAIKSPIWQCRLRVRGIKGYIYRSCETQDIDEAMEFARELYDEKRLRAKNKLPLNAVTFMDFVEKYWLPYAERTLSAARYKQHKTTINRYLITFFGNTLMEDISELLIDRYWDWRRDYWKVGPGATEDRPGNVALNPSASSLRVEKSVLNQLMKHAKKHTFIATMPIIEFKAIRSDPMATRRPYFTKADWKILYVYMNKWQFEKGPGIHSLHRFQRQMLRNLFCFWMNSGMRNNEIWKMRWCDLGRTPKGRLKIFVDKETKTGEKYDRWETIPMDAAEQFIENVRKISKFTNDDDFVFADATGKPMKQSHKMRWSHIVGQSGSQLKVYSAH